MKYWVNIEGELPKQYSPQDLVMLPGFQLYSLVSSEGDGGTQRDWQPAGELSDIREAFHDGGQASSDPVPLPDDPPPTSCMSELPTKDTIDELTSTIFRNMTRLRKTLECQHEYRARIKTLLSQESEYKTDLSELRGRNRSLQERTRRMEELEEREQHLKAQVLHLQDELAEKTRGFIEQKRAREAVLQELKQAGLREAGLSEDLKKQCLLLEETNETLVEKEANLQKAFRTLKKVASTMEAVQTDEDSEDGNEASLAEGETEGTPLINGAAREMDAAEDGIQEHAKAASTPSDDEPQKETRASEEDDAPSA